MAGLAAGCVAETDPGDDSAQEGEDAGGDGATDADDDNADSDADDDLDDGSDDADAATEASDDDDAAPNGGTADAGVDGVDAGADSEDPGSTMRADGGVAADGGAGARADFNPVGFYTLNPFPDPSRLFGVDLDGVERELSPPPGSSGVSNVTPSPDGAYVAFWDDTVGFNSTWVVSADGQQQVEVATTAADFLWSPTGDKLAIDNFDLSVMNPDGTGERFLGIHDTSVGGPGVEWSPDGSWIAWLQQDEDGDATLLASPADAEEPADTPLLGDGSIELFRWSPLSNRLVARVRFDTGTELLSIDPEGGEQTTLLTTNDVVEFGEPAFSADGSQLAVPVVPMGSPNWALSTVNVDGSGLTPVFADEFNSVDHAVWHPVEPTLAVVTTSGELHLADADGTLRLSEDGVEARNAMWSRDGSRLGHTGTIEVWTFEDGSPILEHSALVSVDPPQDVTLLAQLDDDGFAIADIVGQISVVNDMGPRVVVPAEPPELQLVPELMGSEANQLFLKAVRNVEDAPPLDVAALILFGGDDPLATFLERPFHAGENTTEVGDFSFRGIAEDSELRASTRLRSPRTASHD